MNPKIMWVAGLLGAIVLTELAYAESEVFSCTTTREYVTVLEFLRERKELNIPDPDAQKTALEVSKGCTGAATRFIRVSGLLTQAGLGPRDSINKGLEYAKRTDQETDTFSAVFKRAYAEDAMDLDLRASMNLAESLTHEFEADTVAVRDDFEKLMDYCASSKKLGLPKPQCGAFAARLAKQGQKFSGGISGPYIEAFEFMSQNSRGPGLAASKAIELSNQLIHGGPGSTDNFVAAYRYAISKKGLAMTDQNALSFALQMGLESIPASK